MNARKKLCREVERQIDRCIELKLFEHQVAEAHATGLKKILKHIPLVRLAQMHENFRIALDKGQKISLKRA